MSQSGNKRDVRILRVRDQAADRVRVAKSNELPGLAGVNGLIYAVSADDVAADASLARTHINDVRIGFGNGERPDGRRGVLLLVKNRLPIEAAVRGLPNATRNAAEIIGVVLAGDPGYGEDATTTEWPDEAVGERLPWAFIFLFVFLGGRRLL